MCAFQYTVIFKNNSKNSGTAGLYQTDSQIGVAGVNSLIWLSHYASPTTQLTFTWKLHYDFVWYAPVVIEPGTIVTATQVWPTNLVTNNQVTLTQVQGSYTFKKRTAGPQQNTLYVVQDDTIARNQVAVGIGMSRSPTFVTEGQPNLTLAFTPKPRYWITFGQLSQGQVVVPATLPTNAEIVFPINVYSMTAVLNSDNSWTIQQTSKVNAALLQARKTDPDAVWGD